MIVQTSPQQTEAVRFILNTLRSGGDLPEHYVRQLENEEKIFIFEHALYYHNVPLYQWEKTLRFVPENYDWTEALRKYLENATAQNKGETGWSNAKKQKVLLEKSVEQQCHKQGVSENPQLPWGKKEWSEVFHLTTPGRKACLLEEIFKEFELNTDHMALIFRQVNKRSDYQRGRTVSQWILCQAEHLRSSELYFSMLHSLMWSEDWNEYEKFLHAAQTEGKVSALRELFNQPEVDVFQVLFQNVQVYQWSIADEKGKNQKFSAKQYFERIALKVLHQYLQESLAENPETRKKIKL